jgi:hypothetical protein
MRLLMSRLIVRVSFSYGMRQLSGAAVVILLVCLFSPHESVAQVRCDPALPRNDAQSSGYRPRGDRCEGIYKRPVSSFGVQLISLTAQTDLPDLCGSAPVYMVWPVAAAVSGAGPIHVQAESMRPLLYYRLDVDRQASVQSFQWPPDPRCNNEVSLKPADLGILSRTAGTLGGKPIEVFLPVGLAQQPTASARPPYQASLMPGRRLREVYVSIWRYGTGTAPTPIVSERPLSMRPYPAGTRVTIPFSAADLPQPGLYRVRASVEFDAGEIEAVEFYFVHAQAR